MYGLLRVPKGYLAEPEQALFQGHYCALCHALGRCGFQGLRLATSYDATALALFYSGLTEQPLKLVKKHCPFSPWRKKDMVVGSEAAFDFAARASLGIAALKARDELADGKSRLKGAALKLLLSYLDPKAPAWPEFRATVELQAEAEGKANPWFDELAYPSGHLLGSLAARAASLNGKDERLAFGVGENLGKWIYTWDALWDFAADFKEQRFNAIAASYNVEASEPKELAQGVLAELDFVLDRCVNEALRNLELLNLEDAGQVLGKMLPGAHNWHKQAFIKEFFKEDTNERLPKSWQACARRQFAHAGGGTGVPDIQGP